jgi:hypothetical protein
MRSLRCSLVFFCTLLLPGQRYYSFGIDQDQISGAPDFSFLNSPIDNTGRVFVKNGAFYTVGVDALPNTDDDQRIRFFGVNLAFGANFPTAADAPRVAKRLRRLGVNLVRLHHMDTQPDSNAANAGSILTTGPYPTLNPIAVERLRTFLDALRAEGVYYNLNIHVGYTFRPGVDGVPALENNEAFPSQSKPLIFTHPELIEKQAIFAERMSEALQLRGDPGLAMVEIMNETSLLHGWRTGELDQYLNGAYRGSFAAGWNGWLRERYATTEALRAAWGEGEAAGPELLSGRWTLERHASAQASFSVDPGEDPTLRVNVSNGSANLIMKQVGFTLEQGKEYVAELEVRADLPDGQSLELRRDVKEDVSPWRTAAAQTVRVDNTWRRYRLLFRSPLDMRGVGRFAIDVERTVGSTLFVRRWTLRAAPVRGLGAEESLEAANLALPGGSEGSTVARMNDYLLYLAEMDRRYMRRISTSLRASIDALTPLTGTQMEFGGVMNMDSHNEMDYIDRHVYVDHYGFPNVAWDGRDWTIRNDSAVQRELAPWFDVAASRVEGKPYTVSEFNQNWPNSYGAELAPIMAALAARQDWDGLMHFAYSHDRGWDAGVPKGFNLDGDWTKWINFGQSALLFRSGLLPTAAELLPLPLTMDQRLAATRGGTGYTDMLARTLNWSPASALERRVALRPVESEAERISSAPTGDATMQLQREGGNRVSLDAPAVAGLIGFFPNRRAESRVMDVELLEATPGNFAALLLTSLDGQPLADSRRLLLSNPGNAFRSLPGSNPPAPQLLTNYPGRPELTLQPDRSNRPSGDLNGGSRPVFLHTVSVRLRLKLPWNNLIVYPLNGRGERMRPLSEADLVKEGDSWMLQLQTEGQELSPWFELLVSP